MSKFAGDVLTIGTVAQRTGVSVAVLRAWEQRFGFPEPTRSGSGHRRYSERHVEQIDQVVRDRAAGLSLEAAIVRARRPPGERDGAASGPGIDHEPSIFAGLRRRLPHLTPHVLSKRTMLAISHAIEDEYCATADEPILLAAFQRQRFYRASEARYHDLARTAAVAIVFADFPAHRMPLDGPVELALERNDPLLREWAVVCDAPGSGACLAGWERPGQGDVPDHHRIFEAIWSVEPEVVGVATEIGLGIAERREPTLDLEVADLTHARRADPIAALRRATALTNRIVAYVERPRA